MTDRPATKLEKKPGRKQRVAGRLLLVIGVLIAGVWGASRWWRLVYFEPHWYVRIVDGNCSVEYLPDTPYFLPPRQLYVERLREPDDRNWWLLTVMRDHAPPKDLLELDLWILHYMKYFSLSDPRSLLIITLWPFALASLLGGGWLVWLGRRSKRRAMMGVCLKCGYDLVGLAASAPCPECGGAGAVQAAG